MTYSVPGVLVSRDGSVRRYMGHSNQSGTLFGFAKKNGRNWISVCVTCEWPFGGRSQGATVAALRNHWEATHDEV